MKRFFVTYEIVTHESAEHGDAAERGFVDSHGWQDAMPDDICGPAAATWMEPYGMRLSEAIELMGCLEDVGGGFTYYESDGRQNYQTGAETRFAFHLPRETTAASLARVRRALKSRRLI